MAQPKRSGSTNGHSFKIVKPDGKGHSGPKVSTFREAVLKIFDSLLAADVEDQLAWSQAGPIAIASLRHANCPIESTGSGSYDGQPMSATITKSKNGSAKKPVTDDPFHVVVSRGVARFIEQQGLSLAGADKKYGFPERFIYRLVKEATPGRIGENIDKVSQAFGITRQHLIDLGTPP
jgi:hypothetical protein